MSEDPAVSADESVSRAEGLLDRLEAARARLEETSDPDAAIQVLSELAEIARDVEAELERARRDVGAGR